MAAKVVTVTLAEAAKMWRHGSESMA